MKFDLCKAFGVEEGQEFRIVGIGINPNCIHKIEDRKLKFKTEDGVGSGNGWLNSALSLSEIDNTEIEILPIKKSIPEDIRDILEKFNDFGCFTFNFDAPMWKAEGSYTIIKFDYLHPLYTWAQENLSHYKIYRIDDILSGNF